MKKTLAIVLSVIIVLAAIPLMSFAAETKTVADLSAGDKFTFGSYPQSKVTDQATLTAINGAEKTWKSYGYMESENTPGDYMQYCDIDLDGDGTNDYRCVKFSKYRSSSTTISASDKAFSSQQANNGYFNDAVYYFAYEPLTWRVLDADTGLVMCESIIDSQAYNDYCYSGYVDAAKTTYTNKWKTSSICQWLNEDFYNTAFSSDDKTHITLSTITNKGYSSTYDYDDTEDNIFLLSYQDALNTDYGFASSNSTSDAARQACGTDYAKSQGLWVSTESSYLGNSYWLLRSAGSYNYSSCYVSCYGYVGDDICTYSTGYGGVRPAFYYNLQSCEHSNLSKTDGTNATCTTDGVKDYWYCADCKGYFSDEEAINEITDIEAWKVGDGKIAAGHEYDLVEANPATCTEDGNEAYYKCKNCTVIFDANKNVINEIPVIPAAHEYVFVGSNPASCTANGNEAYYKCKNCTVIFDANKNVINEIPVIPAGHTDDDKDGICDICEAVLKQDEPTVTSTFSCPLCEFTTGSAFADSIFVMLHSLIHILYGFISAFKIG